jgi:predicted transcriptional regulator of viral defense system
MNSNNWNCNDSESTTYSNSSVSEKLTMLDVCTNELIFIKKADNSITFEYKPMDPIRSCSGSYSGGTPVFKNLKQNS